MFRKRGWHKRGISPLIATVLLIAFAVSIGAMIMNWGKDVVAGSGDCNSTKIEFQQMKTGPIICYDTTAKKITTIIKNTGEVGVTKVTMRTIAADYQVADLELESSKIKAGGVLSKSIPFVKSGKFRVEFIPSIMYNGQEKICSDKALAMDDMPVCQ